MERYFYRRGMRVPVTQVDVVAIKDDTSTADTSELRAAAMPNTDALQTLSLSLEEADAFAAAGWKFVRHSDRVDSLLSTRSATRQGDADTGEVYRREDGGVLIATRELVVQFAPELTEDEVRNTLSDRGLEIVRQLRFAANQFEVRVPAGIDPLDAANELQESGITINAEPEFIEHIGQRVRPSDPTYAQQWHLNNPGGSGGTAGADIAAERAWDFTRGAGVRIAVIDNGFDVGHADLTAGIVADSGFFDGSGNFQRTLTNYPDSNHGTFCAGMVGARHNNGRDGCGSAPECELMLVATRNDQVGTQATLARAVAYASNPRLEIANANPASGADVIVSSLGPNGAVWALTAVLENAIVFASRQGRRGRGTPIFWASSNGNNVDIAEDQVVSHPQVIAVGRSRRNDTEDNSAHGEELDLLAPGVNVVSITSGGGTGTSTGTSFAAPLAAGVGALVLAVNPDLYADEVRQLLCDTCDKIAGVAYNAAGHHIDYGHGRVNAFRAVVKAMHTIAANGVANTDRDGNGVADIPVVSPWGIGTLHYGSGTLSSPAMKPNGTRFDGWLLNTADNRFPQMGRFAGNTRSQTVVTSPWGIGVLQQSGDSYTALMLKPNGTRFGGWLLNTVDNRFGPVGDFDGDGRAEIVVRSPWGIALLKLVGNTFVTVMMAPNGTRFGGWLLNTADNHFGPVGDFDGDGRDEMLVHSPWGIGMFKLSGSTFATPMMAPNGTRFGGWLLNTGDNWLGPVGDYDGDGRDEIMIGSPWGIGMLELSGNTLAAPIMAPNGTRFGGWLLNSFDNRLWAAADLDGDGRDELFITSPWGVGVLELSGSTLRSAMLKPNGTRFGGWLLNTADNQFRRYSNLTGTNRACILVESPWGVGIFVLRGNNFDVPMMAPNGTRFGGWLLNTADNRF